MGVRDDRNWGSGEIGYEGAVETKKAEKATRTQRGRNSTRWQRRGLVSFYRPFSRTPPFYPKRDSVEINRFKIATQTEGRILFTDRDPIMYGITVIYGFVRPALSYKRW